MNHVEVYATSKGLLARFYLGDDHFVGQKTYGLIESIAMYMPINFIRNSIKVFAPHIPILRNLQKLIPYMF